jgi:hypothetical protein
VNQYRTYGIRSRSYDHNLILPDVYEKKADVIIAVGWIYWFLGYTVPLLQQHQFNNVELYDDCGWWSGELEEVLKGMVVVSCILRFYRSIWLEEMRKKRRNFCQHSWASNRDPNLRPSEYWAPMRTNRSRCLMVRTEEEVAVDCWRELLNSKEFCLLGYNAV